MYKALPKSYSDVHKVKARFKKRIDEVTPCFNKAFGSKASRLRQRAIFAYPSYPTTTEYTELFYIFPINNYKFLYSHEVMNSNSDYKQVIDTLFKTFDDADKASDIMIELLKYTYSTQHLYEGIIANTELIFYGIPYYYAVRTSACLDYNQLIKHNTI
ncbi:hypothetical protein M0R04_06955 [Candidatus Dojkabacteria bacterium]|nr:hypothetical protein [Candidatus Dojkabacteria bacterium]